MVGEAGAPAEDPTPAPPPSPLAITTLSLPDATQGSPYAATLVASGGTAPYMWVPFAAGTLPGGLTLAANGAISGTPTAASQYTLTVQVTDSAAAPQTATATMTMIVAAAAAPPPPSAPPPSQPVTGPTGTTTN